MNKLEPTTKIDPKNPSNNGSRKEKITPAIRSKSSSGNVDKVTITESFKASSSASKSKSVNSDIRHELVNKFRDVLQKNSYEVKANEIADKIVQKIRENKNHLVL
jgi:anti-sigma28 factor (negative regulator of flagellin synthesis)